MLPILLFCFLLSISPDNGWNIVRQRVNNATIKFHIIGYSFPEYSHPRQKRDYSSYTDCFGDVEEPLYGFRTRVTLAENSPCTLGVTCRGVPGLDASFDGENGLDRADEAVERQTGEEFFSEAPSDCRVTCN